MPIKHDDGPLPHAFEGLDDWASQVASCITKAELGALVAGYRKIAGNRRLSAANRRLAKMQADALERARPPAKKNPTKPQDR